jgi:hypothetical protein
MSTDKKTVTPKDVAEMAAEDKLVTTVPAQAEGEKSKVSEPQDSGSGEKNVKKSLKDRLTVVTEKLKANKKVVIAVGAAVGVATIAFVKYAKKQAEAAIDETLTEEQAQVLSEMDALDAELGG